MQAWTRDVSVVPLRTFCDLCVTAVELFCPYSVMVFLLQSASGDAQVTEVAKAFATAHGCSVEVQWSERQYIPTVNDVGMAQLVLPVPLLLPLARIPFL